MSERPALVAGRRRPATRLEAWLRTVRGDEEADVRMSKPVGIGTGVFAGTLFAALLFGDGITTGLTRGLVAGVIGFAVSFAIETRKAGRDD